MRRQFEQLCVDVSSNSLSQECLVLLSERCLRMATTLKLSVAYNPAQYSGDLLTQIHQSSLACGSVALENLQLDVMYMNIRRVKDFFKAPWMQQLSTLSVNLDGNLVNSNCLSSIIVHLQHVCSLSLRLANNKLRCLIPIQMLGTLRRLTSLRIDIRNNPLLEELASAYLLTYKRCMQLQSVKQCRGKSFI